MVMMQAAYQIKGKEVCINMKAKSLILHTPLTLGRVERPYTVIVQIYKYIFIELSMLTLNPRVYYIIDRHWL